MKSLLLFLTLMGPVSLGYAALNETVERNSAVQTSANASLSHISNTRPGSVIIGVVFSTAANARVRLYDSQGTATNLVGDVGNGTATTSTFIPFNVSVSSGITYTITGNGGNGVSIIYKLTHPR